MPCEDPALAPVHATCAGALPSKPTQGTLFRPQGCSHSQKSARRAVQPMRISIMFTFQDEGGRISPPQSAPAKCFKAPSKAGFGQHHWTQKPNGTRQIHNPGLADLSLQIKQCKEHIQVLHNSFRVSVLCKESRSQRQAGRFVHYSLKFSASEKAVQRLFRIHNSSMQQGYHIKCFNRKHLQKFSQTKLLPPPHPIKK